MALRLLHASGDPCLVSSPSQHRAVNHDTVPQSRAPSTPARYCSDCPMICSVGGGATRSTMGVTMTPSAQARSGDSEHIHHINAVGVTAMRLAKRLKIAQREHRVGRFARHIKPKDKCRMVGLLGLSNCCHGGLAALPGSRGQDGF